MPDINFFLPYRQFTLKNRKALKEFISKTFVSENRALVSLQIVFCSDSFLLEINQQYLQHNYYTDIITFNLGSFKKIEAEIYISIERVKDNARSLNVGFQEELHRVIFHGVLHLCGYKDKLNTEIAKMRAGEDRLLNQYFKKS